jgi:hypothetical protein
MTRRLESFQDFRGRKLEDSSPKPKDSFESCLLGQKIGDFFYGNFCFLDLQRGTFFLFALKYFYFLIPKALNLLFRNLVRIKGVFYIV